MRLGSSGFSSSNFIFFLVANYQICQSDLQKQSARICYDFRLKNAQKDTVAWNFHFSEIFCHCYCNCATFAKMHLLYLLHIFLLTLHFNKQIKYLSSQLILWFIWNVLPVTVLEKVSVSVTLVQTSHLAFFTLPWSYKSF